MHKPKLLLVTAIFFSVGLYAQAPEPDGAGLRPGTLPEHWNTGGPDCSALPAFQIHQYNPDFYILRESGCTHYEKPFIFLFFGETRALLVDTGAGKAQTSTAVRGVIAEWAKAHNRAAESIDLVVAHSHSHGDHIAGDSQFQSVPHTTLIPLTVDDTASFFHITKWPDSTGSIDLGKRTIDVVPIPGHDKLSVAYYDAQTGVLLTGDTLYPGRLYISDFPQNLDSIRRLVAFTADKPVAHALGNHIEQTNTPFLDYKVGTKYQPQEHQLALSRAHLLELLNALEAMQSHPKRLALRDFTVWPK
jgi:hydroxyacylglutathione hydrolase